MKNETTQTITVKFTGELIIQKNDLKEIFLQTESPHIKPSPESPKLKEIETDSKLPRLAFTVQETAEMLGVSYITIYRFIRRGLLKYSFASRKIIISKVEIERFLKETSRSLYEK